MKNGFGNSVHKHFAKLSVLICVLILQFNYLTAPANNINVNVVQQQKFRQPYPEYFDHSNRSISVNTTPNSTLRSVHSVKNQRNLPPSLNATLATNNSFSYKYNPSTTSSNHSNHSTLSSQSRASCNDKANSLSLCINRINLLKSVKSNKSNKPAQFHSMRCRKHRHRSHHFNIESYQRYHLTKSFSNDTVSENGPPQPNGDAGKVLANPQTTYKFI